MKVHVKAFLLADPGVVPQVATAVPSPPTGHTGARAWLVKLSKPPRNTIPHIPSSKGPKPTLAKDKLYSVYQHLQSVKLKRQQNHTHRVSIPVI